MLVPTRPSMRRPPAGSTNDSRSVSDFQPDRAHRADQAERDVDDVIAGRQHDVRGRAALLADQLERAGIVGLVGEHPPHQPAIDDRQILAVTRRQRQHRLACGRRRPAAARPAGPWRSTAARWSAGSAAREGSGLVPGPEGGARFMRRPGRGIRNRGRRHRRRAVLEHLGRGRRPAAAAEPASRQAPAPGKSHPPRPCSPKPLPLEPMAMLFTENAANSSLRGKFGR